MSLSFKLISENSEWDQFTKSSPQGSVFSSSGFLQCYECEVDYCAVEDDGKIVAAVAVLRRGNELLPAPMSLGMYQQTIHFSPELWREPPHVSVGNMLKISEFLIRSLWEKYGRISFFLHPSLTDLRALSWFHYQEPGEGIFQFRIMYTGILNLGLYRDFEEYLRSIRRTRRQEYGAAERKGLKFRECMDLDLLVELHRLTYDRQGIEVTEAYEKILKNIVHFSAESGCGRMMVCSDSSGKDVAATLFLRDERTAYYLVGANHPDSRPLNAGPCLLLENIKFYHEAGIKIIDLVGINSPNRGDFKISFNCEPKPYYIANCASSGADRG